MSDSPAFHNAADIYDAGYCVMKYDIYKDFDIWRHRDQLWELPPSSVQAIVNGGIPVQIAPMDDVITAFADFERTKNG